MPKDSSIIFFISSRFKVLVNRVHNVLFTPLINIARKIKLRNTIQNTLDIQESKYDFSKNDIDLYVEEQFALMRPLKIFPAENSSELIRVTIEDKAIYWPKRLTTKDLPWLYHEIFDDFNTNPSSYNHPLMDLENRKWVMDAGAAEGYFSVFSLLNTRALIIALEPLNLMRTALKQTLDLYADGRETIIVSAALSDKPGRAKIHVDFNHICDSTLTPSASVEDLSLTNLVTESVVITTIDILASEFSSGPKGLIKMDIEGYEMAALNGAVNLMKNYKPALSVAVYHDIENAHKCAAIIKAANPSYKIEFRGCYGYFNPPRPYMIFAY